MSDAAPHRNQKTLGDYEAFVATQPDDTRWELVGGRIFLMTTPNASHGLIVGNIFAPLQLSLRGGECRAFAGGLLVQRSEERTAGDATIPDVVVHCGPRPTRNFTTNAVVVVEVLSRSTMLHDRGAKLDFYRILPSLRHIALIYQGQMRVEHFRRVGEGWIVDVLSRPSDRLDFDAIGFTIGLDAVYVDIPVLRPVETPGMGDDEPATLID